VRCLLDDRTLRILSTNWRKEFRVCSQHAYVRISVLLMAYECNKSGREKITQKERKLEWADCWQMLVAKQCWVRSQFPMLRTIFTHCCYQKAEIKERRIFGPKRKRKEEFCNELNGRKDSNIRTTWTLLFPIVQSHAFTVLRSTLLFPSLSFVTN
jgi:hypothetical protein